MRLLGWVGASIGLHGAFFVAVLAGLIPLDEWTATVEPDPIDIEILAMPAEPERVEPELREPEVAPEPQQPEEQVASARVPAPIPHERPPREPRTSETADSAPSPVPSSTIDVPEVTPDPRALSEDERRRRGDLVNPASVAASGFDFGPGPSQRGAPAGLGTDTGPTERDIEASLASGLRAEAMTKRHLERAPFRLQRRADGSHVWAGPRLTGIIQPDGSVRFEDRPGFNPDFATGSATFDLTEAMMGAAGQDPLRAERDYFMRQTEELRARLEAEHRSQEMTHGLRAIPGRLTRIWQTESRTPESRRLRIFRLWDEVTEDDPSGQEARAAMIRWIRLNLPQGSEFAYTADELARFNARRESREEFAPY